jgi:DNA-binding NarL/FixJ family response regulator
LQRARQALQELDMPYLAACVRVEIAGACRTGAHEAGAELVCEAARAVFARIGAAPDVARIAALMGGKGEGRSHGLTARELQVLRMLASGKTNKAIATRLTLSEKTVDRHVSNILDKLAVPSRAGATAYAYQHKLI